VGLRLISGRDFGSEIEKELRGAKAVVVLWCSLSIKSEWVREEAALAKRLDKMIPVRIEDVELPLGFSASQTLALSDWDGAPQSQHLERLLRDIAQFVNRTPKPNLEGLDRTARAWRRFGSPSLRKFALVDALERRIPPRTLPSGLYPHHLEAKPASRAEQPAASHARVSRRTLVISGGAFVASAAVASYLFRPGADASPPAVNDVTDVRGDLDAELPVPDGFYLVYEEGTNFVRTSAIQLPDRTPNSSPLSVDSRPMLGAASVAHAQVTTDSGEAVVVIQLTEAGGRQMYRSTNANINRRMAVVVNGVVVVAPVITEPVQDEIQISGNLTEAQARAIASRLNREANRD
jgi:hypothetical protein